MDKTLKYREVLRRILASHAQPSLESDVETQLICDEAGDHYLLMYVGWRGHERVRGCVVHVDIKHEQIWIQHDGTEYGIANELADEGVPKEDIVLGFRAPYRRRDSGFGEGLPGKSAAA